MENRLRSALVERMQQLSMGFYLRTNAGVLQTKVVRDVENIEQMVRNLSDGGFVAINGVIGAILITALKVPMFLPFFLILAPCSAFLIIKLRQRLNNRNEVFRSEIEDMSARVNEMTTLIPITRAHGLEQSALRTMYESFSNVKRAGLSLDAFNANFNAMAWVTFQSANVLCLATAAKGFASIRSLGEVLESPDIEANADKPAMKEVVGIVDFKDVTFTYPGSKTPAITNLTLRVKPGEMIALVGPSGSGKSTLINLAIGFLRPQSGLISFDGNDLSKYDLRAARKFISVVPQESVLFDGSVRENITYGLGDLPDKTVIDALTAANAIDFVEALPEGVDTIVGERGARISGGQKQRLAIARALIRNPRILVLDEATSALDSESERSIQKALESLMANRTTFVVAHRLSTVQKADTILVLQEGNLVEQGTHLQLSKGSGLYQRLFEAQTFIDETGE